MNTWEPELVEPHVVVVGFEELGFEFSDDAERQRRGVALSKLVIEHAGSEPYKPNVFAADPDQPNISRMRYTGPNFFRLSHLLEDMSTLQDAYCALMPGILEEEFGEDAAGVQPLPDDRRAADAFITNPERGETTNWHRDGYLTAAGYPIPGAGLIISHCVNPRDGTQDLKEQPSTLVVPKPLSVVFFLGNQHAHRGIDLGVKSEQSTEEQKAAWAALKAEYSVERVVSNLGLTAIDQNPDLLVPWEELGGDRVVLAFDFVTEVIKTSSFDEVLVGK